MRNSDTTKNQGSIWSKLVDVISNANAVHALEDFGGVKKVLLPVDQTPGSPPHPETGSKGETGLRASFVLKGLGKAMPLVGP
tara:strand:- start:258 stop:503 length:246 start_codon:yes stop_codon:yes gene_type:complete